MIHPARIRNTFCVFTGLFLVTGCSSIYSIKSDPPDTTVFIKAPGQNEKVRLGQTPLQLTAKQLETEIRMSPSSVDFIEFSFEKIGFQTEIIKVPPSQVTAKETTIMAKLKSAAEEGALANKMIKFTLNAQKLSSGGDYERAIFEVDKALEIDSRYSQGFAMKGNIYFLKGDYEKSLENLEKANFLDPSNEEVLKMITFIRTKKLNQPASPNDLARELPKKDKDAPKDGKVQ